MPDQEPDRRPRSASRAGADPEPRDVPADEGSEEERAKPLFREEADGVDAATVRTPAEPGRERPLTFVPQRRPRTEDDEEEATTLLPRTSGRRGGASTEDLLDDENVPRRGLGNRTKLALLVSAVAAVVVVGLAIGYAVTGVQRTPQSGGPPSASTGPSVGSTAPSAVELLTDTALLGPLAARPIDAKRTWAVRDTIRTDAPDAPGPACLGSDPLEGAPTAQQKVLRTLSSTGANAPGALHVAQAYSTPQDASQAFEVTARALGSCAITGDYLDSGRVVTGVGDEATGSLIKSVAGSAVTGHTVLVSRTGRVLNVVDAFQPKDTLNVNRVGQAMAAVIGSQCQTAGGACATAMKIVDGPPPAGGDEPGFLATGDLPPATTIPAPWVGAPVEPPAEDFAGSSCETVNWSTLSATDKSSRVYLLQDVPGIFGLNDVVVTLKDAASAQRLVEKTRTDWTTCKERKLTATVATPTKVTGVATGGVPITGYTTTVDQKAGDATTRFRVGIASSGTKVAFTFLNPQKGQDLTADQWNMVTVRAVQRATQPS